EAAQWVLWHVEPFCDRRGFYSSGCGMARYPRRSWLVHVRAPKEDAKLSVAATRILDRARGSVDARGERWAGRVQLQRLWRGRWVVVVKPEPGPNYMEQSVLHFTRRGLLT